MDYGAGKGHFIKSLIEESYSKAKIFSCEFSQVSVDKLNSEFAEEAKFGCCFHLKGNIINDYIGFFDIIFILEVIEHLNEDNIANSLEMIQSLLKKGGYVFISTPNNEDLRKHEVLCPDCGALFHPVQHINSFTKDKLIDLCKKFGFDSQLCKATYIGFYQKCGLKNLLRYWYFKYQNTMPNLIYIGSKK